MTEILPKLDPVAAIPETHLEANSYPWSIRLITFGLTLGLFGILAGGFYFWDESKFQISPALSYTSILAAIPLFVGLFLYFRSNRLSSWRELKLCPYSSCWGLLFKKQ